jgi:hypothetical protein
MKHILINKWWCALLGVITLLTANAANVQAGQRGLFVGRYYYRPANPAESQQRARDSKMNTLFLFTMEVEANGSLVFNTKDTRFPLVTNGVYVGDASWPAFLAGCKEGSVTRIEMCIGQWGSQSFNNIRNLINSQGTGSSSILYRNFQALKNKLPISAIQMDDENTYDRTSMVRFCKMLKDSLGLWVSFCPYTNMTFWADVKRDLPDRVSGVWLQCYDGGANNDPQQWRTALAGSVLIYPGCILWDGPTTIEQKMRNWKNQGFNGGFVLGDIELPDPRWGQALINAGFGDTTPGNGTYKLINEKSGLALDASGGNTGNGTPLVQWNYGGGNNQRWNLEGLGGGQYKLTGVASGRTINVEGASQNNNARVVLYDWRNENNAKFTLTNNGMGYYSLRFVHSGKAMTVFSGSTTPGTSIIQYTYNEGQNARWQFLAP